MINTTFNTSLFCVHKNALLGSIIIRKATINDEEDILDLFVYGKYGTEYANEFIEAIKRSQYNMNTDRLQFPFLVISEKTLVGIILLE